MTEKTLSELTIRTAVVREPDTGYVLACDPETEEAEPHVRIFKWHRGSLSDSWANFNAHRICLTSSPKIALVFLSPSGNYAIHSTESLAGNVFEDSKPAPKSPRYSDIRALSEIDGKAYAAGLGGAVYRLDKFEGWTRIDDGLPDSFGIEAIHGFGHSDIYTVGSGGEAWNSNGRDWTKIDLPTNAYLTCVKCAGDGNVYIAGHDGILLRGRDRSWEIIDTDDMDSDIWDLEWFKGELYLSTMSALYKLDGDLVQGVKFGKDTPKSYYHLSAVEDAMWSIGGFDVMSFDGKKWRRVV